MKIQRIAKDGDENVTKWYLHTSATMLNGKMVLARFSVHICGKEQVLKLSSHCFCVISHMWALFIPMTLITSFNNIHFSDCFFRNLFSESFQMIYSFSKRRESLLYLLLYIIFSQFSLVAIPYKFLYIYFSSVNVFLSSGYDVISYTRFLALSRFVCYKQNWLYLSTYSNYTLIQFEKNSIHMHLYFFFQGNQS